MLLALVTEHYYKIGMLKSRYKYHKLIFKQASGTSRGVLHTKDVWYIHIWDSNKPHIIGIGECTTIPGLSIDHNENYEEKIIDICNNIDDYWYHLEEGLNLWPSIKFGLETALRDLQNGGEKIIFPSDFTKKEASIDINGLIWMGDYNFMKEQIQDKLNDGFTCIKLKIGALNFHKELNLIKEIRKQFSKKEIEIRVDANGAFSLTEAEEKLRLLALEDLHSIEQPIKAGNWLAMKNICKTSPLPIALDEELIGIEDEKDKIKLLETINPQYIILKPSLLGGFKATQEWIDIADKLNIKWWVTSALESNIGLNAIAQWTFTLNNKMPQGLGTGKLYTNNIESPLEIKNGKLYYKKMNEWEILS